MARNTTDSLAEARELVSGLDGKATVTSLEVSDRFRRTHEYVADLIQGLDCSEEFYKKNFERVTYRDRRDLEQVTFKMTRDGFVMLAMALTGRHAAEWRERYIRAFNVMEAYLTRLAIERAETRGRSKTVRVAATDSYKDHGATAWFHYANNTDAIYEIMFGGSATQLRRRWGLAGSANIRDHLSTEQLNHVIQIEGSITLQLDQRNIFHPDDQLLVVRHVTRAYKVALDAPLPAIPCRNNAA